MLTTTDFECSIEQKKLSVIDWTLTEYSPWNNGTKVESIPEDKRNMVVPLVFQYLTPKWVAFIGESLFFFNPS